MPRKHWTILRHEKNKERTNKFIDRKYEKDCIIIGSIIVFNMHRCTELQCGFIKDNHRLFRQQDDYPPRPARADNRNVIEGFRHAGEQIVLVDSDYEQAIEGIIAQQVGKVQAEKDVIK